VLVVDEEHLLRWAISRTLVAAGHRVTEATDARSAIGALRAAGSLPDVILLDWQFADGDGRLLLEWIRAEVPGTAVVVMTIEQDMAALATAVEAGANSVMRKPFDMAALGPVLAGAFRASIGMESAASDTGRRL